MPSYSGVYRGSIGIMEKKMESTIRGLEFKVQDLL